MNVKGLLEKLSRKQLAWLLGTLFAGITLIFLVMAPETPRVSPQDRKPIKVNLLGNADLEKENWRATAEKEIEGIKTQQKEISEQLGNILKKAEEKENLSRISIAEPKEFPPTSSIPPFIVNQLPSQAQSPPQTVPTPPLPDPIKIFGPEISSVGTNDFTTGPLDGTGQGEKGEDHKREEEPYLPSGSFVSGILLSGLDAPAGVNSSKEPHPVLIKLSDLAVLPNRFRFNIKDCFIIGEGYGDLSSERAYIRTTTLSCVMEKGNSVDVPLKGFVAGEDGKVGLRGRVVSKQGQFLARALAAGFAEGLSNVFRLSATTVSTSPLGTTQTLDPKRALEAGAFGGASRALERLAQHYIDMAERLFPVIEIDAGRKAEVVILQGRKLPEAGQVNSNGIEENLR